MSGLTSPQERAFVAAYARSGDPVEAARSAGYSAKSRAALRVAANRLLSRERVRNAVARERAKLRSAVSESQPEGGGASDLDPLTDLEAIARNPDIRPSTRVRALELIAKLRRDRAQLEAEIAAANAAREAPDDRPTIVFVDNGRGPTPDGSSRPTLRETVEGIMCSPERGPIVEELARRHAASGFYWPENAAGRANPRD